MAENEDVQMLRDAAKVHAVSGEVREAVAALAVRPLDEAAAGRMRQLLAGDHAAARASLNRLRLVKAGEGED